MKIIFHPHALERMKERGTSEDEVRSTIETGELFPAKFGRSGFRHNFQFNGEWKGKFYSIKQVEVYPVQEDNEWLVITLITRYFNMEQ